MRKVIEMTKNKLSNVVPVVNATPNVTTIKKIKRNDLSMVSPLSFNHLFLFLFLSSLSEEFDFSSGCGSENIS